MKHKALTLIEVLVALTIIALLASIVIYGYENPKQASTTQPTEMPPTEP